MKFREDITIISPGSSSGDAVVRGTLQNTSRSEDVAEGSISVTDWLLFLPVGTAITRKSRVQARGREFEVTQEPYEFSNDLTTNTPHHMEVTLKITGDAEATADFTSGEDF